MKAGELVTRSLRQHFHAAVVIVAHPSGYAEHVRLPLHEPAEANALHASTNQKTAGLDWLFSGSHLWEIVILSRESASRSEADLQSKDPYYLKIRGRVKESESGIWKNALPGPP
jgi:hypothetical protein